MLKELTNIEVTIILYQLYHGLIDKLKMSRHQLNPFKLL